MHTELTSISNKLLLTFNTEKGGKNYSVELDELS